MTAPFLVLIALLAQGRVTPEEAAASHARMQKVLARLAVQADQINPYVGTAVLESLREKLASLPSGQKPMLRFKLLVDIGFHELRLGEASVGHYEEARALVPVLGDKLGAAEIDKVDFDTAIAWLRLGETQNCVARHTSESCILPIGPGGVHVDQEGSRRSIALLETLLERNPMHVSARWILNIAHMTVGTFPEGVPERQRLPSGFFDSEREFPRFAEVAGELGLDTFNMAGGALVDDFDGDGVLDIVTSGWGLRDDHLILFRGTGGGEYAEDSAAAGFEGITGALNLNHADYDNDGDLDILMMRGAWLGAAGMHPPSLLANDGRGHFIDVSFAAGVAGEKNYPGQGGDWADYDNDGDLDLYLGHETQPGVEAPCQLFRNDGDGTFTDVAEAAGVVNKHFAKAVAWGDVDGDRYPDLYVSNQNGQNRLYVNRRDGTFEDVAVRAGVERPLASFPTWIWDYDNDGNLDIYVAAYWPELAPSAAVYFGLPAEIELARLYRGDGRGGFRDVALELGLDRPAMPMSANYGDLDGDGWLDFYLGTGYPGYDGLVPNLMFWNDRGQRFLDVTTAGGFGHLQKGHGIAFADLDADGDVDVFSQMGGAFPGDAFGDAVYRNPGFGHRWVEVSLVGVRSNRFGIGAHLRFDVRQGDTLRSIHRWMDTGASFGSNPLRLHVGLGRAEAIERLEVHWPTSDTNQVFEDVPLDASVVVTEGQAELRLGLR